LEYPARQTFTQGKVLRFGNLPKTSESLRLLQMPEQRGGQGPFTIGRHKIGVGHRPAGIGADLVERYFDGAFHRVRPVGGIGDDVQQFELALALVELAGALFGEEFRLLARLSLAFQALS